MKLGRVGNVQLCACDGEGWGLMQGQISGRLKSYQCLKRAISAGDCVSVTSKARATGTSKRCLLYATMCVR